MKRTSRALLSTVCLGILAFAIGSACGQTTGSIVGWGGQVVVGQSALDSLVAVAAGVGHSLGLKSDGAIVAWGSNGGGQCNVPAPNEDFIAVAGGGGHSLGLKSDGTIVAWGYNGYGQCDVPAPNADFIGVAGGVSHSLGLRSSQPTAVTFANFTAGPRGGTIALHWEIATDEALRGFRVYRAQGGGVFACITQSLLPASARNYEDRAIEPGKEYRYVVGTVAADGPEIRSPEVVARGVASLLALQQNVPNPFNPQTVIAFSLPSPAHVQLDVYDLEGRLVRKLVDERMQAGPRAVEWNGRDDQGGAVASGVYFYRLTVGKQTFARKMILLK